jgi:large subunit ribosomal protein L9
MQVILQENVEHLGKVGDVVKVKDGYARNYLLPRGLAAVADARNVAQMEHHKKAAQAKADKLKAEAEALKIRIEAVKVVLTRQVGEGDKLFGSVTSMDVEAALHAQGLAISRKQIVLPDPIKALGVHEVSIKLQHEVVAKVKVNVTKASA